MLILSRRVGEEIVIGRDIIVRVVATASGSVRLGIDAPPSVTVDRLEVRKRRAEFAAEEEELHWTGRAAS